MRNQTLLKIRNEKLLKRHDRLCEITIAGVPKHSYEYILYMLSIEFHLEPTYIESLIKSLKRGPVKKPSKTSRKRKKV